MIIAVIHITLAIAAFMQMLAEAIFWVAARFAGYAAAGAALIALPWMAVRGLRRKPRP